MAEPSSCGTTDLHECEHKTCWCFWCRLSRREPFETIRETQEIRGEEAGDG